MKMSFVLIFVSVILNQGVGQLLYDCPSDWYKNGDYCYKFEGDFGDTYDGARNKCNLNGAWLLSIDALAENTFIAQWLLKNDPFQQDWSTSGRRDTSERGRTSTGFMWESTGKSVEASLIPLWIQPPPNSTTDGIIIYTFGRSGPGWLFATDLSVKRSYICKIPVNEAYRILNTNRGYEYGSSSESIADLEIGPHFIVQPQSVVVVSRSDYKSEPVNLECVVQANPEATYKWFRGETVKKEVTKDLDSRYTITNGKLTITEPDEAKDSGVYRCEAQNKFGKVISNEVEVAFGSLGEFNNVQDAGSRAVAYDGATIECSKIQYKPAISYQWIKGNSQQFVRPEFQKYIFISNSGKLYFSEVTRNDDDQYMCVATLTGVNRYTIGSSQPPMRTSLPIPLIVNDAMPKSDWGPQIQNDFIGVFPKPPMRGQDVRLECFAYGSSQTEFVYTWSREDKPMPQTVQLYDHNRVLMIRNAQLEDSGLYRCTVSRGTTASDTKTVLLTLAASPYFVSPLEDQHTDIDSQLTWICNARANPDPVYHWYKNGELLTTQSNTRVKVQRNVLTISQLDPDLHNGMYQCAAQNTHGTSLSNAQLRVLAFAPTIERYPPPKTILAPNGGNITVRCQPEAAPFPTIKWLKDGSEIVSDNNKYTIYGNGNLRITLVSAADQGTYTCRASNTYGQAEVSTTLSITTGPTITTAPANTMAIVNKTVFIACEASYPKDIDMIYDWTFYGFPLDFTEPFYKLSTDASSGAIGLYIIAAQFKHEGLYTCTARTPFSTVPSSAYLTMNGPPREPAGVVPLLETVTHNSTQVTWLMGSASGGTISVHTIQISNEFEANEWTDKLTINVADSYKETGRVPGRQVALVPGLNPGTEYRFRVIAHNEYGRGTASEPSIYIHTVSAAPEVAPQNLRGGGGSVGDLTIRWDPLKRSEWGSKTVGYRIYWRRKEDAVKDAVWGLRIVDDPAVDHIVVLVGADFYYLLYEVKVQAFSDFGFGPNSSIAEVYSAEELPIATALNLEIETYNSTAVAVTWEPVPDTREYARGKILGYQLNYWYDGESPEKYRQFIRYYGQIDNGLVIGLNVEVNIVVDIQVFNSAGLGPRSNYYVMETFGYAPWHYPQEVHIASAGHNRAYVWWRGVTIEIEEEQLFGYAIWLWTATEDPRSAELIELESLACQTTLHNISENRLYAMRIAATGNGGYGKKSPTVYFTTEGQILIDKSLAETIELFKSKGFHVLPSLILSFLSWMVTIFILSYS